eukprot:4296399-Amphidinium_carterae.1
MRYPCSAKETGCSSRGTTRCCSCCFQGLRAAVTSSEQNRQLSFLSCKSDSTVSQCVDGRTGLWKEALDLNGILLLPRHLPPGLPLEQLR